MCKISLQNRYFVLATATVYHVNNGITVAVNSMTPHMNTIERKEPSHRRA